MREAKECTSCRSFKSDSEFYTKGSRLDARCKTCVKAHKKNSRKEKLKKSTQAQKRRKTTNTIHIEDFDFKVIGEFKKDLLKEFINILVRERK
jgi:hypothetical protein